MQTWLATLVIGVLLLGCKENGRRTSSSPERTDSTVSSEASPNKAQTSTQTESTQSTEATQEPPRPKLDPAICKEIEKNLKNLSFPYKVEIDIIPGEELFSPEIQSEMKSKINSLDAGVGQIYPIGKLRYPKGTIWLIGVSVDPTRADAYAFLVDENCQLQDELTVATRLSYMSTSSHTEATTYAIIKADGSITTYEKWASLSTQDGTSNREESQKRYRVDFDKRRFVAL